MGLADARRALALLLALLLVLAPVAGAQEPAAAEPAVEASEPAGEDEPVAESPDAVAAEEEASSDYDEFDDLYFEEDIEDEDTGDPIEPVNRAIFWVNDGIDRYALEPVSTVWDWVFPDFVQRAMSNGFDNLRFPIVFFNHLFQLKFANAGKDVARFAINSTVGIGGLMDPAETIGLPKRFEDFGQTLGYWGVPPGPYLMLPFFGPSNLRDGFGLVVDSVFRAIGFFIPFVASVALQGVDTLNRRSLIRDELQAERRAALDWYAAVRSAYSQYRENLINDRRVDADQGSSYYGQPGSDDASNL
ncbi:MAG: MlaA family lipoprotein [Myxococcota bacterium]